MRKLPTGSHGFTLLELLMAISIGSIVVTAVYGTFHTAIKAKTRAEETMAPLRSARYFFSAMKENLQLLREDAHVDNLDCETDHCSFPIRDDNAPMHVSFLLNSKKELIRERRQDETNSSNTIGEARQEILGRNVTQLHFEKQVKTNTSTDARTVLLLISVSFASNPVPMRYDYAIFIEKALLP